MSLGNALKFGAIGAGTGLLGGLVTTGGLMSIPMALMGGITGAGIGAFIPNANQFNQVYNPAMLGGGYPSYANAHAMAHNGGWNWNQNQAGLPPWLGGAQGLPGQMTSTVPMNNGGMGWKGGLALAGGTLAMTMLPWLFSMPMYAAGWGLGSMGLSGGFLPPGPGGINWIPGPW